MNSEQEKQAWLTSLRLLSATPKSSRDLSKRLSDKGYADSVIQSVIKKLEDQSFLNDRAFANNLVNRYTVVKPSGKRKIQFELKRRGIHATLQNSILEELPDESEQKRAREIGLERWEKLHKLPLIKRKKRVYDFLLSRGFAYEIVRNFMEELPSKE